MFSRTLLGFALVGLALGQAGAVSLSVDSAGQVLLLPLYRVGNSDQTLVEIRNTDPGRGRAVRLVTKDPINGRPTLAINLYLGPLDSWSGALYDPSGEQNPNRIQASLARWTDTSCTLPAQDELPPAGLALSDRFLDEDLSSIERANRVSTGFIEVYEMGVIDAELAGDCQALMARWLQGAWSGDTGAVQNQDVAPPAGGLEAYAAIVNVQAGLAYHVEALVLDDFRNQAIHTHPDNPIHPNLADVSPAESRVLESVRFANRTIQVERVSAWSEQPINAIDALLMTVALRTDFSANADIGAITGVALTLPTRAYHSDPSAFYGGNPELAPFRVSVPPAPGEEIRNNVVGATVLDRDGYSVALTTNSGATNCDLVNGSLTTVFMTNQFGFDFTCEFTRAEFRVHSTVIEGQLSFLFDGEIVSDEGHVYRGWPVYGVLLQTLVNNNVPNNQNFRTLANYGWARIMKRRPDIRDPE